MRALSIQRSRLYASFNKLVGSGVPVLSAQLITAPTGRPSEMRNLAPEDPPRPVR